MKSTLVSIFRKNLKFYRQKKNLTQEKLSELLKKNANYIGLIENGKSIPPLPAIEKIANFLNIKPMILFDENGCIENILPNGKEEFASNISEEISKNLKKSIFEAVMKEIS